MVFVNLVLNIILMQYLEHAGLALVTNIRLAECFAYRSNIET